MTATNHALVGAVIAVTINKPWLALPLAFASHFALDSLPHFGYPGHGGFSEALKYKTSKVVALADPVLFLVLFMVLVSFAVPGYVYAAAALAASPDVEWLYSYLWFERSGNKRAPKSFLAGFHESIQWCERPWGIWVEAAWLVIFSTLLIWLLA